MDVAAGLDRIFSAPLQEADLSKAEDELFKFLSGLTREEYEIALSLLPDRPKLEFEDKAQTHGVYPLIDYTESSTKQVFWDTLAYFAIINYNHHVSATEILSHLLKRTKNKPGGGLRTLARKLSSKIRSSLFEDLLALEGKDAKGRPLTQGEFEDYLENVFLGDRIGMLEYGLEELLDSYKNPNKKNKNRGTLTGHLEKYILTKIQHKRREEFAGRLGAIDSVNKARFATEELHRQLYVYPNFNVDYAANLFRLVDNWYIPSKARQKVLKNPALMEYSHFFDELRGGLFRLKLAVDHKITDIPDYLKPTWDAYIFKFLRWERFWHNLQGLNSEIPLEQTEAGVRIALYKRWALATGAVYLAVMLLPVAVAFGIRAPGAVVSVIRWTGGKLLLGTQYAYTTIRVFGLSAGAQRIATDIYHFYLRNSLSINQAINTVTEISLDLSMGGTGMAPGSSPADISAAAAEKIGRLAGKGISKLADEALAMAHGPEDEIRVVELILKNEHDGNYYRMMTAIQGGGENIVHLKVDKFENLGKQIDLDAQKIVKFHSRPKNDNSLADARGTAQVDPAAQQTAAAVEDVGVQQLKGTGTDGPVITMGPKTAGSSKPIIGSMSSTAGRNTSKAARHTSNNGAGLASRLSGSGSKKPVKLKIDLSKPGAMKGLANATAEDVVNVLRDPKLFNVFKQSLRTSEPAAIQAANDIMELGNQIARFTVRTEKGVVYAEKVVSDAAWALPGHFRGILIEHSLAASQYRDWFRAGQLDGGWFPDIDFRSLRNALDQRVSLKTVDPFAKNYSTQLNETLVEHLETLVTGMRNSRARGYNNITVLLDVRMPLGTAIPRADLLKTLKDLIPKDLKQFVAALVDEF
ncbi:MAG: hypothetical protein ACXWTH_12435 [Methylosarcina sp.]